MHDSSVLGPVWQSCTACMFAPGYTSYGGYQYPSQWQPGQPWWDPVSQQYLYPPQVGWL